MLENHLRAKHTVEYETMLKAKQRHHTQSIGSWLDRGSVIKAKAFHAEATKLTMLAAAVDNRPFGFSMNVGISKLFKHISDGKFVGVSRTTIVAHAREFEVMQLIPAIDKLLDRMISISITADCWTSISLDPYLGITAHGITFDTFE